MCWPLKKTRTITGILTQDVFNHAISYTKDGTFTIYINNEAINFSRFQATELKNSFKIGFAVLLTLKLKMGKLTDMNFRNIFKISDSTESNGITGISFFYRNGKDVYRRTVTKASADLQGFQSAAVTKPWFYINERDDFIIINEYQKFGLYGQSEIKYNNYQRL